MKLLSVPNSQKARSLRALLLNLLAFVLKAEKKGTSHVVPREMPELHLGLDDRGCPAYRRVASRENRFCASAIFSVEHQD